MLRMDELAFRFEAPNGKARWDAPLFVVKPIEMKQPAREGDPESHEVFLEDFLSNDSKESPSPPHSSEYKYFPNLQVLEDINQAIFHSVAPRPNLATQAVRQK